MPPWLAEEHPDILDWENLNKYASEFATSESGGKGQFLGADPSYVQFDEAIVSNLDLDFKVVFSGSEAASIEAFRKAEENKEWVIGYWYEPQYFNAEVPMQRVALPPYEDGLPGRPADGRLRLPGDGAEEDRRHRLGGLRLHGRRRWSRTSRGPTRTRTSSRATSPSDGMSPEDAAAKWIEENQDKVDAWLRVTRCA